MKAHNVSHELLLFSNKEREKSNECFFKTGPGEYGEGDKFIGVCMPDLRKIAKKFQDLPITELQQLIESPIHEERMCALVIATHQFKSSPDTIYNWYLENTKHVNNWDLVDTSCHQIIGEYLVQNPEKTKILEKLSNQKNLWERRISIISTFAFIRLKQIDLTLELAEKLLTNKEDLMHKATGWMLRECWRKDPEKVEKFLIKHYQNLPRTTLRYAIERIEETKRKRFLKGEF